MGKAEVEKVRAMKLSVSSFGTPRDVCVDCRDMLTNMIRYMKLANMLTNMIRYMKLANMLTNMIRYEAGKHA
jgi:hypothetical protein